MLQKMFFWKTPKTGQILESQVNSRLNFTCTKCGSCCTKAPKLSMKEMLDLSDTFFIQLSHNVFLSYDKSPLSRQLEDHYSKFCKTFILPEKKCKLFYFVQPIAISHSSQKCSALSDNLCSIFYKKPNHCALAPLDVLVPEERFSEYFAQTWQPLISSSNYSCDISSNAQPLYENSEISSRMQQNLFYLSLEDIKACTDLFLDHYLLNDEELKSHIHNCFLAASKNAWAIIYSSASEFLAALAVLDKISMQESLIFAQNQLSLIDKLISQSLEKKNPLDKEFTKLMRSEQKRVKQILSDMGYADKSL